MSRRVVLTSETWSQAPRQLERLAQAGFELVERYDLGPGASLGALSDGLRNAWGVIAGGERYGQKVFDVARSLRIIGRPGAGYDAIDLDAAGRAGVLVFSTPGVNKDAVADFALALMLAVLRKIVIADSELRAGRWRSVPPGRDLHAATVGIVGLGEVGRAVARRLQGFDCRVIGTDPVLDLSTAADDGIELVSLIDTLRQADVVTLHVALTDHTRGLIGPAELATMRPEAILINTSRGPVVQQDALVNALRTGQIAGAALDVLEREPPAHDEPLLTLPNVVVSSHIASHTIESIDAMVGGVVEGMLQFVRGILPRNSLNAQNLTVDAVRNETTEITDSRPDEGQP